MAKKVNETTINMGVYAGSTEYIGVAQVTMPTITYKTETIDGAGIPGDYDSVMIGQTDPLNMGVQFRGMTRDVVGLLASNNNIIELRPVIQTRELGGAPKLAGQKHVMVCQPKSLNAGTLAPKTKQDVPIEFSVTRWEAFEDGRRVLLIDKLNFIHEIDGVDHMRELRKKMGRN